MRLVLCGALLYDRGAMMAYQFLFLTSDFYADYANCTEIEQKPDRPHVRVLIRAKNLDFAIPMRSHIRHPHAFLTDKINACGLDYTKAVVITKPARYIDSITCPHIRQQEFDCLRGKEYIIERGMAKYIDTYKKALLRPDIPRNATLLKYSTLQYFHKYIGVDSNES